MSAKRILVVDDDPLFRDFLKEALDRGKHEVDAVDGGPKAVQRMEEAEYDLVLSDIRMPGMDGMQVLEHATRLQPDARVMMITAHATVANAVDAMAKGAFDYLEKGCSLEEIEIRVARALESQQLKQENQRLKSELQDRYSFGNMVGKSRSIEDIFEMVKTVAKSRSTVLIAGESGTGKELVARAIHYNSPRKSNPFVKLNCAALPPDLIESELFGHEKGAFTGAIKQTRGRFELADGGTLLLDEISEIDPGLQAKLLRVLQEREFERVGSGAPIKIDVRIVATTNRNLLEQIEKGAFREDLYYRLNVIPLSMPALRERKEDVLLLVNHFLNKYNRENEKEISGLSEKAMELLTAYNWPGNVRELENYIERAVVICQNKQIGEEHLPLDVLTGKTGTRRESDSMQVGQTVREMEQKLILKTLESCNGNRTQAADLLGISSRTLRNKLHEYGMAGIYRKGSDAEDPSEDQNE
ncbi:MAG: sigma-54 dependent transcriptional regulator [bacterium]|nr:sigma-54 dependent transcriptional regulator [bacterium]